MRPVASPPRRRRFGVGHVELVPEPVRFERLRANVADTVCRLLVLGVLVIQAADTLTTAVALQRAGYYEQNPVFGLLAARPAAALVVKLAAIGAVMALALLRLPKHRARTALMLALALSVVGPIINVVMLSNP